MKIHIIGCSGSGKTYLAKQLSKRYKVPRFDLDDINWDNSQSCYGVKKSTEERNSLLLRILKNDSWIIEGVYYSWVEQCFEDADVIYVLDMPEHLYKWRIIKRSIKRKIGLEDGKKETLKSVVNLLKWTERFQNVNMKEIRNIMETYGDKVVWLSNKKDIHKILNTCEISYSEY